MHGIWVMALLLGLGATSARALELLTEENPPLNYVQNGQVAGTATQVLREMVQRAGLQANFHVLPWSEAFSRARVEPTTCVYSTVRNTDRDNQFRWVGPIVRGYWSAFALEGFPRLKHADELKKYRIGVTRDARAAYLRQRGYTRLIEVDDNSSVPRRLTLNLDQPGGVDLWVTQGFNAQEIAAKAGVKNLQEAFAALVSQDYWLACNLELPAEELRGLTEALREMRKDGTYRKLTQPTPRG